MENRRGGLDFFAGVGVAGDSKGPVQAEFAYFTGVFALFLYLQDQVMGGFFSCFDDVSDFQGEEVFDLEGGLGPPSAPWPRSAPKPRIPPKAASV